MPIVRPQDVWEHRRTKWGYFATGTGGGGGGGTADYIVWPTQDYTYTWNGTSGTTLTWNETSSTTLTNYYGTDNRYPMIENPTRWLVPRNRMDREAIQQEHAEIDARGREAVLQATEAEIQEAGDRIVARAVATDRAEGLLGELLTPAQRETWRLNGYFEVIGSAGTVYRLCRGVSGNVVWYKPDGSFGGRLCAHPDMRPSWLPTPDVLVSQMLALTTDERAWLAVANVHEGHRPALPR